MAKKSKGKERYGSILVKDGNSIGASFNRAIVHKYFKLKRMIRQGYTNHAEVEALHDALVQKKDTENSQIYCARYFPDSGELFFYGNYSCTKGIPHLEKYGIKSIYIPTSKKWIERPLPTAKTEARNFLNGTNGKRKYSSIGKFRLEYIEKFL